MRDIVWSRRVLERLLQEAMFDELTAAVMRQRGYDHKPRDFWLAMNVMYSDFGKVAQKHNLDKPEFFADLADAFLTDPDAQTGKLARYYRDIVQH